MLNIDKLKQHHNNCIEVDFKNEISSLMKEESEFIETYTNEHGFVYSLVSGKRSYASTPPPPAQQIASVLIFSDCE